jgi:hypothetical protein
VFPLSPLLQHSWYCALHSPRSTLILPPRLPDHQHPPTNFIWCGIECGELNFLVARDCLPGLYKQLAALKDTISDWRETHAGGLQAEESIAERSSIFAGVEMAGLQADVPFFPSHKSALLQYVDGSGAAVPGLSDMVDHKPQAHSKALQVGYSGKGGSRSSSYAAASPSSSKASGAASAGPPSIAKVTGTPPGAVVLTEAMVTSMTSAEWALWLGDLYSYLQVWVGMSCDSMPHSIIARGICAIEGL